MLPTGCAVLALLCSVVYASSINVALHAQSNFALHGFVAGSEVTTAGLRRALERLDGAAGGVRVKKVQIFAPFSYAGLTDTHWDLAIVEGWTGPVPKFIAALRRANPALVVLYWCLDTQVVDEETLGRLDVNGFLTNSAVLEQKLRRRTAPDAPLRIASAPASPAHRQPRQHHWISMDS